MVEERERHLPVLIPPSLALRVPSEGLTLERDRKSRMEPRVCKVRRRKNISRASKPVGSHAKPMSLTVYSGTSQTATNEGSASKLRFLKESWRPTPEAILRQIGPAENHRKAWARDSALRKSRGEAGHFDCQDL